MISVHDLSAFELAALLSFHADCGVEWLIEDEPVDRLAEFAAQKAARAAITKPRETVAPAAASTPTRAPGGAARPAPAPPTARAASLAVPDEHAVNEARFAAESATSLAELKEALLAFNGCNLKTSARSSIFATGDAASGIMIVGPAPSGDDDREGMPFSGRAGLLLDRMLAAIGLAREGVLLTHILPWRPPGDRAPSQREAAICRPFIERQIELAEPRALLLLGNFTARYFFGATESINSLRGRWRPIAAGAFQGEALASLHPLDLMSAPATKAMAWQDLLTFRHKILPKV